MIVFDEPNRALVRWDPELKTIIHTIYTYAISYEDFRKVALSLTLPFAKEHEAKSWIVDSNQVNGVITSDIITFINDTVFPFFNSINLRNFIVINTSKNLISQYSTELYMKKARENNINVLKFQDLEEAVNWLKSKDLPTD